MNDNYIESDRELCKMAQSPSSLKTPESMSWPLLHNSNDDFENFLDAVNSHVARLVREGVECLESAASPVDVDASRSGTSQQLPVSNDFSRDGGVPFSPETPETSVSTSSGGLELSESRLNLSQPLRPNSKSDTDECMTDDSSSNTHTVAGLYTSAGTSTSSVQASSSDFLANPGCSSGSGSWASGERTWPFGRVVSLLQHLLGGRWARSLPGSPSHVPSLNAEVTVSSPSALSVSDRSDASLADHIPRLSLDLDDAQILEFDIEPSIADNNRSGA